MSDNVSSTNSVPDNLSQNELLRWVNKKTSSRYTKFEELSSGTAYCQLMDWLFPGSIPMKRVKFNPKSDHEHIHNLTIFRHAFAHLDLSQIIPIERLMKGRSQDNFEFLQWFKKFYDLILAANEKRTITEKSKCEMRNGSYTQSYANEMASTPRGSRASGDFSNGASVASTSKPDRDLLVDRDNTEEIPSPLQFKILSKLFNNYKSHVDLMTIERDFYFKKLAQIHDIVCDEEDKGALDPFLVTVQDILYSRS